MVVAELTTPDVFSDNHCICNGKSERLRKATARVIARRKGYPSLRAEDLVNAWAYARVHSAEIELQIRENEVA